MVILYAKPGDIICCHLSESKLVSSGSKYDQDITATVLLKDSMGYFVYVPNYIYVNGSHPITHKELKSFKIHKKFLGEYYLYVADELVIGMRTRIDGMVCTGCHCFANYAEANQEDGTFLCFSCRSYPYYGNID